MSIELNEALTYSHSRIESAHRIPLYRSLVMNAADELSAARQRLVELYRVAEPQRLPELVAQIPRDQSHTAIEHQARELIAAMRATQDEDWIAAFLREYQLSSAEGLALLTLAEAYLRVPDALTASQLLHDKLAQGNWQAHSGRAESLAINSATFGLVLAQSLLNDQGNVLRKLMARAGEPFIRTATTAAMRMMAGHFVLGETIEAGLTRAREQQLVCSFDMLGEAARTADDAQRYFAAYAAAIHAVGKAARGHDAAHSISVKLSALHPRYEVLQAARAIPALVAMLRELAQLAANYDIGLTVDAEESERLELSLDIIEQVARSAALREWQGFGMAVQAYQKRATAVIDWAAALARATQRKLVVRLVKGAYWDTEIKRCQERGLSDYPVFTRKAATDASYLACARRMLREPALRPAFATHNALTVATLLSWIATTRAERNDVDVEFQRLHGMGAALYARVAEQHDVRCRVYAPIGGHRDLLAYLVRRMLENGANSSFIHQVGDVELADEQLLRDPVDAVRATNFSSHPRIPLPKDLYGTRLNAEGLDLSDRATLDRLNSDLEQAWQRSYRATPISSAIHIDANAAGTPVRDPAQLRVIGHVLNATVEHTLSAIHAAQHATAQWSATSIDERAACLERMADLIQGERTTLLALLIREAGKTRSDAIGEVREAIDYCRYYASQARALFAGQTLPGPTGELNTLRHAPRGVFACISPWNFPLAIFLGQISAALVTGNSVVAKPAPQTPLIADVVVRLLLQAGIPTDVVHLLPGGAEIGDAIVAHRDIAGVAFTGSTRTGRRIAQRLLDDDTRPLVPLIAETGGVNAMIVDSTALPEQVTADVLLSAFNSAGQRCSALRLLCVQDEVYEAIVTMLQGAMAELRVGDPADESTDVGPLIDEGACRAIRTYVDAHHLQVLYPTPCDVVAGWFVSPTLIAIDHPDDLRQEVFGPVLHVTRWRGGELPQLLARINASGYGLTLGVHTRLESTVQFVREHAHVGNVYVNRSMIGAVVGVQPFGGEGLSGTGPKAGGPNYLSRFCTERTVSIDTTSAGGNASLMSLET